MSLFGPVLADAVLGLGITGDLEIPGIDIVAPENTNADVCVHLQPADADGNTVDLYWSQRGFVSSPSDTPANQHFKGRLAAFRMSRGIAAGGRLGGRGDLKSAELEVVTLDGAIRAGGASYGVQGFLRAFSIVGRDVEVRMVSDSYENGLVLFKGTADEWSSGSRAAIRISLRGKALAMNTPAQPATYGGTGGEDGGEDLEGKRKPVGLGRIRNARPTLEDASEGLYRLHTDANGAGAPIQAIDRVLLDGTPLTPAADYATTALLLAATRGAGQDIEPGEYGTCLAEGAFRLGTDDNDGTFSVDFRGGTFSGSYVSLPGELARAFLENYGAQLASSLLDTAAFGSLDQEFPHGAHLWLPSDGEVTQLEAFNRIMESVGASWTDCTNGLVCPFPIRRASNSYLLEIGDSDIVENGWEWVAMPRDVRPVTSEITVGHQRNYFVTDNVAGGTADADRAFFREEYRTSIATQSFTQFLETAKWRIDTLLDSAAGGDALAAILLAIYNGEARRARIALKRLGYIFPISGVARVTYSPEGVLQQNARIIGIDTDTAEFDAVLDVLIEPPA